MSLDENVKLSDCVENKESLFRGIPDQPSFIKEDGSITSAILKDSHGGVSVDRDANRKDSDVIAFFCKTQKNLGKDIHYAKFLKMPVLLVRQNQCDVKAAPIENINPFHAEITQNGSGDLKRSTAKSIIKQSTVINNPL